MADAVIATCGYDFEAGFRDLLHGQSNIRQEVASEAFKVDSDVLKEAAAIRQEVAEESCQIKGDIGDVKAEIVDVSHRSDISMLTQFADVRREIVKEAYHTGETIKASQNFLTNLLYEKTLSDDKQFAHLRERALQDKYDAAMQAERNRHASEREHCELKAEILAKTDAILRKQEHIQYLATKDELDETRLEVRFAKMCKEQHDATLQAVNVAVGGVISATNTNTRVL